MVTEIYSFLQVMTQLRSSHQGALLASPGSVQVSPGAAQTLAEESVPESAEASTEGSDGGGRGCVVGVAVEATELKDQRAFQEEPTAYSDASMQKGFDGMVRGHAWAHGGDAGQGLEMKGEPDGALEEEDHVEHHHAVQRVDRGLDAGVQQLSSVAVTK